MQPADTTLPQSYFDELYARDPDPWRFATSPYEDAKYSETLAALPVRHYGRALEVGCSIGELTVRLAPRCDHLDSLDIAEAALDRARTRAAAFPQVRFWRMSIPDQLPEGRFDLILLSEVLYYLSSPDLGRAAHLFVQRLNRGADVLLVHWLGATPDYPLNGDAASDAFITAVTPSLSIIRQSRHDGYRLDLLRAA